MCDALFKTLRHVYIFNQASFITQYQQDNQSGTIKVEVKNRH